MNEIELKTNSRIQFKDITREIEQEVAKTGVKEGICVVFSSHTTAGITINENADPDVQRDLESGLSRIAPFNAGYLHSEGNSDAHIKASLMGSSQTIIIENGKLKLGTWQGVYFCEFDGPRTRKIYIKIIKG
jgi:secondary thiamine-phosphate synthase enzyme